MIHRAGWSLGKKTNGCFVELQVRSNNTQHECFKIFDLIHCIVPIFIHEVMLAEAFSPLLLMTMSPCRVITNAAQMLREYLALFAEQKPDPDSWGLGALIWEGLERLDELDEDGFEQRRTVRVSSGGYVVCLVQL